MSFISVVIPTHLRPKLLHTLLESCSQQEKCSFEVIVVDNQRSEETESVVAGFTELGFNVCYLVSQKPGVNRARNLGARSAKGDILLFLDDDCELIDTKYLQLVIQLHSKYPEATAIGGRYALKPNASLVERAYHINSEHWLTQSRLDS